MNILQWIWQWWQPENWNGVRVRVYVCVVSLVNATMRNKKGTEEKNAYKNRQINKYDRLARNNTFDMNIALFSIQFF